MVRSSKSAGTKYINLQTFPDHFICILKRSLILCGLLRCMRWTRPPMIITIALAERRAEIELKHSSLNSVVSQSCGLSDRNIPNISRQTERRNAPTQKNPSTMTSGYEWIKRDSAYEVIGDVI